MSKTGADHTVVLLAYDISEAAAALGLDRETVSALLRAGVIPHVPIGNRRVVGIRALEEWLTATCLANAVTAPAASPSRPTPLRRRRKEAASA